MSVLLASGSGGRPRDAARTGSQDEKKDKEKKEEVALSRKATHHPECCPSQFTWAVGGAERSSFLHFRTLTSMLFGFLKENKVVCSSKKIAIKFNEKTLVLRSVPRKRPRTQTDSVFSVKIYILYSCKKSHVERSRHMSSVHYTFTSFSSSTTPGTHAKETKTKGNNKTFFFF